MMYLVKLSVIVLLALFFSCSFLSEKPVAAFSSGPEPGNTGAPGESTCAGCHSGPAQTGLLKIEGLPATYTADQEFTITVTLTHAGRTRFGFQATVIDDSGNSAGTMLLTDADRTQLLNSSVSGNNRQYIEQTLTGTSPVSGGTGSWTFKWRAPAASAGRITFYVAGNAANGNFSTSGDTIYTIQASSLAPPGSRAMRVVGSSIQAGSSGTVSVEVDALGDENTFGFSLNFDQTRLSFASAQLASGANGVPTGTLLLLNAIQAQNGRVGIAVSLPFNTNIAAGTRQLVTLTFQVPSAAAQGPTVISFGDQPIPREFVRGDATLIPLNTVTLTAGSVNITAPVQVRSVRAVGSTIQNGGSGSVGVEIDAVGNENGLAFSLTFDQAKLNFVSASLGAGAPGAVINLNNTQLVNGRIGIAFALPVNQALASGTQQVVTVIFGTNLNATPGPIQIGFGDSPVLRELVDTAAATLPANFVGGTVLLEPSYEGDTAPRPFGNGSLSLADWVQAGRFAVSLDLASTGSEFQRADCAPRDTRGNGVLSLADWVQAGRYGANLDPVTAAAGPTGPASGLVSDGPIGASANANRSHNRRGSIVVVTSPLARSPGASVVLWIAAEGIENAIAFSLSFDPKRWEFAGAQSGWDVMNGTLVVGRSELSPDRVNLALALLPGLAVLPGWRQLVEMKFRPIGRNLERSPRVNLVDDSSITRTVVDVFANDLDVEWQVKDSRVSQSDQRPSRRR